MRMRASRSTEANMRVALHVQTHAFELEHAGEPGIAQRHGLAATPRSRQLTSAAGPGYTRREPEKTALYRVMQRHLLTFEQQWTDEADGTATCWGNEVR
jgi:hypothetical protein